MKTADEFLNGEFLEDELLKLMRTNPSAVMASFVNFIKKQREVIDRKKNMVDSLHEEIRILNNEVSDLRSYANLCDTKAKNVIAILKGRT